MAIHFKHALIKQAERLHSIQELKDIFDDLNKINRAIDNIKYPFGFENAKKVDNEMICKYPIIKDMVEVANTFPKLNNSVVNNAQPTVVDYLVQDKFGILAHVLLKSKIISEVKEFIEYVD